MDESTPIRLDWGQTMNEINRLPNIGKSLAARLEAVGITSTDELERCGSVQAVLRIARGEDGGCYNMLFALEGAIRRIRWHNIPSSERAWLRERLDEARGERRAPREPGEA